MTFPAWLIAAPILLPLLSAALLICLPKRLSVQRTLSLASSAALLVFSAILMWQVNVSDFVVVQIGGWAAPFGITLVADGLSALMVLISGVLGFTTALYALGDIGENLERRKYHALFQVLLAGVNGAFLTGDLFNLYVWFEVLLISSFVLLTLGGTRAQLKGGVSYVLINLLASILFLSATGLLYGATGTLNMADLSLRLATLPVGLVTTLSMLFLVAFGIKAAIFPLFFWLPSSYHTPPMAITAIFAGLLSKVGVYALIRAFTLLFTQDVGYTHTILLWLAGFTMLTGVLGAAAQTDVRKLLSYHIVSQIGYILLGLALFSPLALAGSVYYLLHNILAKTNLFLLGGVMQREAGSFELSKIGGLYKGRPWLAGLFLISAFSLAGFPPLSGFWAKLFIVRGSLESASYTLAALALVVSLITIYSMTKIWRLAFWKPHPTELAKPSYNLNVLYAPTFILAGLTLVIGLWIAPFYKIAETAGASLLEPERYIEAVLGSGAVTDFETLTKGSNVAGDR